jgi:hypothetical protein
MLYNCIMSCHVRHYPQVCSASSCEDTEPRGTIRLSCIDAVYALRTHLDAHYHSHEGTARQQLACLKFIYKGSHPPAISISSSFSIGTRLWTHSLCISRDSGTDTKLQCVWIRSNYTDRTSRCSWHYDPINTGEGGNRAQHDEWQLMNRGRLKILKGSHLVQGDESQAILTIE